MVFILTGCASGGGAGSKDSGESFRMPYSDENNRASAGAFAGDMEIRKDMPRRQPQFTPFDFYFKHCAMNGNETYYSKTSYDCTLPGF